MVLDPTRRGFGMTAKVALIAGAKGHVGSQLAGLLAQKADWRVVTLGRSAGGRGHVSADLLTDDLDSALSSVPQITHLFYCVRAPHNESGKENVAGNLLMLQRVVEAAERTNALAHIHIVEGGKWYGAHLGPYKTPAREDDERHAGENFYHAQEDWLRAHQPRANWSWSASRPSFVCAVTPGQGRNMISTLGAYAAICKETGQPLHYPGSEQSFRSLTEITNGGLLARAIHHIVCESAARNQAFNVTNGDWLRWSDIWADIAALFEVPAGDAKPFRLADWSADKDAVWASIVARHRLEQTSLSQVANWPFADFFIGQDYDVASDVNKLRSIGFDEAADSKASILSMIGEYRKLRLLP
ncbi:MAG: NAD-dependent epimerase/dehydratase family protein [Xanthobacteraceae bacterium]|nr:NAD-dependent epimerase/dehydratase family protein [Xanthobacteraceae bacterium]